MSKKTTRERSGCPPPSRPLPLFRLHALAVVLSLAGWLSAAARIPQRPYLPVAGLTELTVDALVEQVLARNPSLAQMRAVWQAASARYPQVTSLDDPTFGAAVGPGAFGSNQVNGGWRGG